MSIVVVSMNIVVGRPTPGNMGPNEMQIVVSKQIVVGTPGNWT